MNKPFFSIAIPTYEMSNKGVEYLEFSFNILLKQSFKNFEVIISDHSKNDDIKDLCYKWLDILNIKYYKNTYKIGGSSPNINNAIKHSNGEWIKFLWQDDFLYSENSIDDLKNIIINNKNCIWIASACEHTHDGINMYNTHYPKWTDDIHIGNNRISSPSVITIKNNNNKLYFNEDLIWLMDVEYYKRMHILYGEPIYLNNINVVNRTWNNSLSNTLSDEIKNNEIKLMFQKYNL